MRIIYSQSLLRELAGGCEAAVRGRQIAFAGFPPVHSLACRPPGPHRELKQACLWHLGCAQVTCGSTIKLAHVPTKFRLHSHEVAYSRGSQQQSVTAFPTSDDGNSLWLVLGTPVSEAHELTKLTHPGTALVCTLAFTPHQPRRGATLQAASEQRPKRVLYGLCRTSLAALGTHSRRIGSSDYSTCPHGSGYTAITISHHSQAT